MSSFSPFNSSGQNVWIMVDEKPDFFPHIETIMPFLVFYQIYHVIDCLLSPIEELSTKCYYSLTERKCISHDSPDIQNQ